jgi:hypothetical protein
MKNCREAIERLERLSKKRSDPSDHLINIADAVQGMTLSSEEWTTFYRYITTQKKENFKFVTPEKVVTLGDLDPKYIKKVESSLIYPEGQTVERKQNGFDIHLTVRNSNIIDKDNGKSVATAFGRISESSPRRVSQKCDEKSQF